MELRVKFGKSVGLIVFSFLFGPSNSFAQFWNAPVKNVFPPPYCTVSPLYPGDSFDQVKTPGKIRSNGQCTMLVGSELKEFRLANLPSPWSLKIKTSQYPDEFKVNPPITLQNDTSPKDELGISEREWIELDEMNLMRKLLQPEVFSKIKPLYEAKNPKALMAVATFLTEDFGPIQILHFTQPRGDDPFLFSKGSSVFFIDMGFKENYKSRDKNDLMRESVALAVGKLPFPRAKWIAYLLDYEILDPARNMKLVDAVRAGVYQAAGLAQETLDRNTMSCKDSRFRDVEDDLRGSNLSSQEIVEIAFQKNYYDIAYKQAYTGSYANHFECYKANYQESIPILNRLVEKNYLPALRLLAEMNYFGYGMASNPAKAANLMSKVYQSSKSEDDLSTFNHYNKLAGASLQKMAIDGEITDKPDVLPNNSTIKAVAIRELQDAYKIMNPLGNWFDSMQNAATWDEANGSLTSKYGNPENFGLYQKFTYNISNSKCKKTKANNPKITCEYYLGIIVDAQFGYTTIADNKALPLVKKSYEFKFLDGKWRSPDMKADIIANSKTIKVNNSGSGKNSLCSSLQAGVMAAGGSSTEKGIDPNAWGC